MVKVVMAGGGTAGHVNPLLATAAQLREIGAEVVVLGTATGLESDSSCSSAEASLSGVFYVALSLRGCGEALRAGP